MTEQQGTEPGGAFAPLGGLLEMVDMHAAGADLTREEAVADLVTAGIFRLYGAAGFPKSWLNPDGYDAAELASSGPRVYNAAAADAPELGGYELLQTLRGAQQDAMRHAAPAPGQPCDDCPHGDTDSTWASVARSTREALALLGWPVLARCMPGEEYECGHGYAAHAVAHFATVMAICEHQLSHLEPPRDMVDAIFTRTLSEMARRDAR